MTEDLVLDLETASGNMNRSDSIVVRLDLTNRWVRTFVKTGDYYAKVAVAPSPETATTVYEIVIAHIDVAAGTTEVTQDMIEDTRMDKAICGWVCGAVEQIDFTQIKAQFDTFFGKYKSNILTQYGIYVQDIDSLEVQAQTRYDTMDQKLTDYENQQKINFENWFKSVRETLDLANNGELLLEVRNLLNDMYQMATDEDIDKILEGNYVDEINEGSIFEVGSNQDIDDIIAGTFE